MFTPMWSYVNENEKKIVENKKKLKNTKINCLEMCG